MAKSMKMKEKEAAISSAKRNICHVFDVRSSDNGYNLTETKKDISVVYGG